MTNEELFSQIAIGNCLNRAFSVIPYTEKRLHPLDMTRELVLWEFPNTTLGEPLYAGYQVFKTGERYKIVVTIDFSVNDNGYEFCFDISRVTECENKAEFKCLYNQDTEEDETLPLSTVSQLKRLLYPNFQRARTLDQLVAYLIHGEN